MLVTHRSAVPPEAEWSRVKAVCKAHGNNVRRTEFGDFCIGFAGKNQTFLYIVCKIVLDFLQLRALKSERGTIKT